MKRKQRGLVAELWKALGCAASSDHLQRDPAAEGTDVVAGTLQGVRERSTQRSALLLCIWAADWRRSGLHLADCPALHRLRHAAGLAPAYQYKSAIGFNQYSYRTAKHPSWCWVQAHTSFPASYDSKSDRILNPCSMQQHRSCQYLAFRRSA